MRISLGPGIILQYIIQGLWHPARRVRQIYWRVYNTIYVGNQDGMVPFHPLIPQDQNNKFYMPELEAFL
jgi:splicing factor 3B subunit 1